MPDSDEFNELDQPYVIPSSPEEIRLANALLDDPGLTIQVRNTEKKEQNISSAAMRRRWKNGAKNWLHPESERM